MEFGIPFAITKPDDTECRSFGYSCFPKDSSRPSRFSAADCEASRGFAPIPGITRLGQELDYAPGRCGSGRSQRAWALPFCGQDSTSPSIPRTNHPRLSRPGPVPKSFRRRSAPRCRRGLLPNIHLRFRKAVESGLRPWKGHSVLCNEAVVKLLETGDTSAFAWALSPTSDDWLAAGVRIRPQRNQSTLGARAWNSARVNCSTERPGALSALLSPFSTLRLASRFFVDNIRSAVK